ncbi:protein translocase subunit SecD [Candidatus Collierbacteria bacterium CG17_big_fil_post_rev_8_21_14_2_50_45_7]|uniref:Protein translocase subunit SecD n=1 Tax=Candidatus Collierbacteria bacterium CG17_big_fil_post_rev_8_21_14_2_50_45_7 TaxID=1974536 RepID=A0A2M7FR81_9BACT|nr:MAG: protein translocase subunit SecD [Candidatus Collierbacteria bacterium CG17_big_fil_post_rev_8_21_14_2_50_45_7]
MKLRRNIFFIVILTALALVIDAPKNFKLANFTLASPTINIGSFKRDLNIRQGLDLQGGTEVTLEANMKDIVASDRSDALDSAKEIIARRVDLYGVAEPSIKTVVSQDTYRILVALPGVTNPEEALALIGQTASLDFYEMPVATDSPTYADLRPTGLTGKDLKKTSVGFNSQNGKPEIKLEFTEDGGKKFGEITSRNIDKPVWILLDGQILTAPTVQQAIMDGKAVINGEYTTQEAKNMVITLNAGALPVPINIIKQQNIAPTLGETSVTDSLKAGAVGLALVALFMIMNYGWLGLIADLGLVIYGLLTLAVYKIVPITITLPGLAGFILSIGMAVDSNILVFERMKEESRKGNDWLGSMELGFGKAWDSIKDANIATLITTFVLFNPFDWNFLNSSGMVRGFALTLFLGIAISLFTGIFITRNLLRAFFIKKL